MNPDSDRIQHYQKEIERYTEMIKVDPNSAEGYYGRGLAYGLVDNWKKALADWEKAIQLNPRLKEKLNRFINYARKILSIGDSL